MAINFQSEGLAFNIQHKKILKDWIKACVASEKKITGDISIVFCSDEYLLEINQKFLHHDFYTDIITFDYSAKKLVSGDLFISLDRTKDNAIKNSTSHKIEIYRVIIHGVMHLCGYKDKKISDKTIMTKKENSALRKLNKMSNKISFT